jgi:hypothetical protein
VHHIDWHHENNHPENLVDVCQWCHSGLHKEGFVSREELLLRHGHMELLYPDRFLPHLFHDLEELSDLPHRFAEQDDDSLSARDGNDKLDSPRFGLMDPG